MANVLVIRNILTLSNDEVKSLFTLHSQVSSLFYPTAAIDLDRLDVNDVRKKLQDTELRRAFYELLESKSEGKWHFILHKDEVSPDGRVNGYSMEEHFIESLLQKISIYTTFDCFYLGGGHGGYRAMYQAKTLSGLREETIKTISKTMTERNLSCQSMIFYSCSSALFLKYFRPRLTSDGTIISFLSELSGLNIWSSLIRYTLGENHHGFFGDESFAMSFSTAPETGLESTETSSKSTSMVISTFDTNTLSSSTAGDDDEDELVRDLVKGVIESEGHLIGRTITTTHKPHFTESDAMTMFNEAMKTQSPTCKM